MKIRLDDYIDADVSYLVGLIIARGTLSESHGIRQLTIQFPYSSLNAQGITSTFDQDTSIRLGIIDIQERLKDLLEADMRIVSKEGDIDIVARFMRNSMIWRNLLTFTQCKTSYPNFSVPPVFFEPDLPQDWKREFLRGYADVAGNIDNSSIITGDRNYLGKLKQKICN